LGSFWRNGCARDIARQSETFSDIGAALIELGAEEWLVQPAKDCSAVDVERARGFGDGAAIEEKVDGGELARSEKARRRGPVGVREGVWVRFVNFALRRDIARQSETFWGIRCETFWGIRWRQNRCIGHQATDDVAARGGELGMCCWIHTPSR
jgi:hypothetical protein